MTLQNNRAPFLYYFKLCASFRSHWCIQTWVTVRKHPIWVKLDNFFSRVTLKFDRWPWKTLGHLFNTTSSFVHHFVAIGEIKLELQSGNAQSGSNLTIFRAVWAWYLTDDLKKNNRALLLSNIKLYASFHHQIWIQTWVTVRKRLSWIVTSVTLTFALWPWPFAWALLWSLVITSENFTMIRWWKHSQQGVQRTTTHLSPQISERIAHSWANRLETDLFARHCGPRVSPLCIQHCIQLTFPSFKVNRPSHS